MKRGKFTYLIIVGLIILINSLFSADVNAGKKECENAVDLAEQGAKNNINGYSKPKEISELPEMAFINMPEPDYVKKFIGKEITEGDINNILTDKLLGRDLNGLEKITHGRFSKEGIKKVDLRRIANLDTPKFSVSLGGIVDTSVYLGEQNIKRINFWYLRGIEKRDKGLLNLALKDIDGIIEIQSKLHDDIINAIGSDIGRKIIYEKEAVKLKAQINSLILLRDKVIKAKATMPR